MEGQLVIIYGDHLGLPINSLNQDDHQLLEEIFGREYTHKDMINIPLIMISRRDSKRCASTARRASRYIADCC